MQGFSWQGRNPTNIKSGVEIAIPSLVSKAESSKTSMIVSLSLSLSYTLKKETTSSSMELGSLLH